MDRQVQEEVSASIVGAEGTTRRLVIGRLVLGVGSLVISRFAIHLAIFV